MSSQATIKRLGDIANFKRGYDLPASSRKAGPYPVISSGGVSGYHSEYKVSGEGLVIGRYGTLGEAYFIEGDYWPHNTSLYVTDFKSNTPKYIYYLMKHQGRSNTGDKSAVPGVNRNDLHELHVPYVQNTIQQQKIASFLSALDDKIELNRRVNAELEQMARTLYDYWFVQFDFPNTSGKSYKSSGGQMIYNDQLKREIPENWQVQDMHTNDLFEIIKPKINKFSGTKQYIATADVNGLAMTDGTPITYEDRESRANMQPREYTIWFAKMKESDKHIFVGDYSEDLLREAIFSTGFMGIQTSREAFEYLTLTIHRPYFELVKDANSNGATMAAIGNNDMKNIKLIVPSDEVLRKFHQTMRPILAKIDYNRQQSQKLAELRDWLLPMLMNGQVRVD